MWWQLLYQNAPRYFLAQLKSETSWSLSKVENFCPLWKLRESPTETTKYNQLNLRSYFSGCVAGRTTCLENMLWWYEIHVGHGDCHNCCLSLVFKAHYSCTCTCSNTDTLMIIHQCVSILSHWFDVSHHINVQVVNDPQGFFDVKDSFHSIQWEPGCWRGSE